MPENPSLVWIVEGFQHSCPILLKMSCGHQCVNVLLSLPFNCNTAAHATVRNFIFLFLFQVIMQRLSILTIRFCYNNYDKLKNRSLQRKTWKYKRWGKSSHEIIKLLNYSSCLLLLCEIIILVVSSYSVREQLHTNINSHVY